MQQNIQEGYNQWAEQYDSVANKTRDLDKQVTEKILKQYAFTNVLELGCGTGKNTTWLAQKAQKVTAIDFSEAMLQQAKDKISAGNVTFIQADITQPLPFGNATFDLVTCNLILEHIQHLEDVFKEAHRVLQPNGYFFICELHPAKQYLGSKARFQKDNAVIILDCFVHHTADFYKSAKQHRFHCIDLNEWFDEPGAPVPRLISFLFKKI